ncbi:hypothetical protein [Arthrobacter sp. 179]|uniref:hypothetical protein n=1 Tax=Arthrobacter sp. 179 TaxID=3457734 RepID=UPI0040347EF8
MNRTALVALPIVAALAGCSASPTETAAPATSSSASSSTSAPASSSPAASSPSEALSAIEQNSGLNLEAKESNTWAMDIRDQFLESYERTDESQFSDGTPHQKIDGWYETNPGTLLVELKGNDWHRARMRWLATEITARAKSDDHRLATVTVSTEDHHKFRTVHPGDRVQ